MHELLLSNRDTILFTAPLVFMIFFAALRLDGKLALPQRSPSRRPTHQFDARGEIILTEDKAVLMKKLRDVNPD